MRPWLSTMAALTSRVTGLNIRTRSVNTTAALADNTWMVLVANLGTTKDENADTDDGIQVTYTDDGSVAELEEDDQRHYRVSAINSAGTGTAI